MTNIIKVLSLDIDGVLIQRDFDWELWGAFQYMGRGVLWTVIGRHLNMLPQEVYDDASKKLFDGTIKNGAVDPRVWLKQYNVPASEDDIIRLMKEKISLYPDAIELLSTIDDKISNIIPQRVIAITEGCGKILEKKLLETGLRKYFGRIYSTIDDFGEEKSEQIYGKILEIEGVTPSEVLHVGDSQDKDYKTPRNIGIRACYIDVYRRDRTPNFEVPKIHFITSLTEIPRIIQEEQK